MRYLALLLAAGAEASTGGKPRKDLPPLFLVPSLCGSRIRAWSAPQCTIGSISPGTNTWVNPAMIGGQPYCWCECMRLWGPQMSDLPNCTSRADEGTDAIYNLADGILGMFAHSMSGVIDALVDYGYDTTTLHAMPYVPRRCPSSFPSTDWRNGSASDSSPEGYAFESRIGHWREIERLVDGTPTGLPPDARAPRDARRLLQHDEGRDREPGEPPRPAPVWKSTSVSGDVAALNRTRRKFDFHTGQRAVIYGHSMGTKVAAYFFTWLGSQMSETQRLRWIDEYVGMYVSNGGPLLGSPDIVPTLLVGQTMGMPISLKLIREVLASAGGLTFLMPTPITNPQTRSGDAKDLPAYATPHGQPWFRVTDWGEGPVDEVFGPEVCCGPTSFVGGLEKAFDKSGDSLLGDLAQIIRRASSNDQYVGDVFEAQVTEVRPPVDTVIAGYGVGYKTPVSNSFKLVAKDVEVTAPLDTDRLESLNISEYDGLPLRRPGAVWEASQTLYEQGGTCGEPYMVVDQDGEEIPGDHAPHAKAGDMTVTYASLSVVHDWLGAKVDVHSVPLRTYFCDKTEVVSGEYDRKNRHAVFPPDSIPATGEPRMTIFESRTPDTHTEIWEMDNVVHRDSSNNDVFIAHFLRELKIYAGTDAAVDLKPADNAKSYVHLKDWKPEGDSSCYWDYTNAKCANLEVCEYRFEVGDLHLSQSCRLKATRGPPPPPPKTDEECYWDYARATCAFPTVCEYRYAFGDIRLDDSCRVRADVDYSKTHYATGQRLPFGTFLAVACAAIVTLAAMAASFYFAWHEEQAEEAFQKRLSKTRTESMIHSEDSDRRESRVMTTSTNSVLIGGAGPGAPMAPAVAVKPMSVDEKNRAIRARAVAEAKK